MKECRIKSVRKLEGKIALIGDKSISHRAVMIASIATGRTKIRNFADSQDCLRTVDAFRQMGIDIVIEGNEVEVSGKGLRGLRKPNASIYLGNSGTTMRLILGILAGQSFKCTLTGDESLSSRPMSRVTGPLRKMGADIEGEKSGEFAPLTINGGKLKPISYQTPIPSAQVKSSILFAGLYVNGTTCVKEKFKSRDHTERMLKLFGADIKVEDLSVSVEGGGTLSAKDIEVPGDISSASFFIVGATLLRGSSLEIKSVLCNPTRIGILDVLRRMGAKIDVLNKTETQSEPVCDLSIKAAGLKGVEIGPEVIPSVIDEIPIIMVAAALADGTTVIKGAKELRVKETDRIKSITENLKRMSAEIKVAGDDIVIKGTKRLKAAGLESFGDHRTAMSMAIAALVAEGTSSISDIECVDTSFPGFFRELRGISH